jgi:hypothetical protein
MQSYEVALLLLTGRTAQALESPVDWPALIEFADAQGTLPLLSPACIPEPFRADFDARIAAKTLRTLTMAGELTRLMRAFEDAGLNPITFKGPSLACQAWSDLASRDSSDLDIFVPRHQHASALAILTTQGYQPKSSGYSLGLAGSKEVTMQRRSPDFEVDLHWQFCPPYFLTFDGTRASRRSVLLEASGFSVRTLCPEDHLHFLCLHGSRDCWALRQLADVAALIRSAPIDWDDLLHESDLIKSWRVVGVALATLVDFFDIELPPNVRTRIDRDPAIRHIAAEIVSNIRTNFNAAAGIGEALLHLRLLGAPASQLRYLWRRAVQPNHLDADFFHLPGNSSSLYYLLRPLRIAWVGLGRLRFSRR